MAALLPLVLGGAAVAAVAKRVVVALGFGVVAFTGLDFILGQLTSVVSANFSAVGEVVCLLGVDKCASMVLSAYSVRLAMIPLKAMRLL